jgi:hypothetical protein
VPSVLRRVEEIHVEGGAGGGGAVGPQLPVYTDEDKPGLLYILSTRVITCTFDEQHTNT